MGSPDPTSLWEKQQLFLAACGLKRVSQATSCKRIEDGNSWHTVPENHQEIELFLRAIGLSCSITSDEVATDVLVALSPATLDAYANATDVVAIGELFGYPRTAALAFASGDLLSIEQQEAVELAAGIADYTGFRFSRDHWRTEIATVQLWRDALIQNDLV